MVKFDVAEEESRGDVEGFDPEAPPAKSKSFASKSLGESEKTGIQVRAPARPARAPSKASAPPTSRQLSRGRWRPRFWALGARECSGARVRWPPAGGSRTRATCRPHGSKAAT